MAVTWAFRCRLWGLVAASVSAYVANVYLMGDVGMLWKVAAGIFVLVGSLSTLIAFHISTLRCSETHSLGTLLVQYVIYKGIMLYRPVLLSKMRKACQQPRAAQEAFLRMLISRDGDTEYGRRYLSGIHSLEDYRRMHPITKYDHYRDYFQRLADGEKNVCVADEVERFGISSGTTGKGKLIPVVGTKSWVMLGFAMQSQLIDGSPVQKNILLYCRPAMKFTKSGLPITPLMYVPISKQEDPTGKSPLKLLNIVQNTPFSGFQISTDFEATYVHLLFALMDKNLFMFSAPFTSQLYRAFSILEDKQEMLLEDLNMGRVSPRLNLDDDIRRSLDAAMTPNPGRVRELREEFARGFVGIVGRIWPHLCAIGSVDISGYGKLLDARYTKGIKLYTGMYACTESAIGLNMWLDGRPQQYAVLVNDILVEFIPEDCSEEENPNTLFVDEVEVGKRYEIAITTISGFYRYRMGDVVEVVDFYEKCPVVMVKYRTGELLNLRSEKIDKLVVAQAIQDSLTGWPEASVLEWTCAESPLLYENSGVAKYDMFYLVFIELQSEKPIHLTAEQKSLFDQSLRKQHEFYDHYRKVGTICEARVLLVHPGSFQKLQEYIIATSTASYNQFKMHRKLRTKGTLDLMMKNIIEPITDI